MGFQFYRSWFRNAQAGVPLKMILGAGGAIAFAGIFIALAGQIVTAADAIAIAGSGSGFNGYESHSVV